MNGKKPENMRADAKTEKKMKKTLSLKEILAKLKNTKGGKG